MKHIRVASSQIFSLGHSPEEGLAVRFLCAKCKGTGTGPAVHCGQCKGEGHSGGVYLYPGVPEETFKAIMAADSVGRDCALDKAR